jgi:NMD protein affecting ribosome stability and mRNA decay
MNYNRPRPTNFLRLKRRDRLLQEHEHDTYKSREKPVEPTVCADCGAVFHRGRWQWTQAPAGAARALCPACHRLKDKYPGGYLTLGGAYLKEHRDEILRLAQHVEQREKSEHPLRRIMGMEANNGELEILTTSMELARSLGDAIHRAYKGNLCFKYTDEANILRVRWER